MCDLAMFITHFSFLETIIDGRGEVWPNRTFIFHGKEKGVMFQRSFILLSLFLFMFIGLSPTPCAFSLSPEGEKQLFTILGEIKGQLKQVDKRITELRQDTNKRFEDINRRFEDINRRFGDINRRFEDINRRFEDINKRLEDTNTRITDLRQDNNKRSEEIINFLWIIAASFTTITAAVIALLIWDRRTAVRYAVNEAEKRLKKDYGIEQINKVVKALRMKAKKDVELAGILRSLGLL